MGPLFECIKKGFINRGGANEEKKGETKLCSVGGETNNKKVKQVKRETLEGIVEEKKVETRKEARRSGNKDMFLV